jgi:hypothetical protein
MVSQQREVAECIRSEIEVLPVLLGPHLVAILLFREKGTAAGGIEVVEDEAATPTTIRNFYMLYFGHCCEA